MIKNGCIAITTINNFALSLISHCLHHGLDTQLRVIQVATYMPTGIPGIWNAINHCRALRYDRIATAWKLTRDCAGYGIFFLAPVIWISLAGLDGRNALGGGFDLIDCESGCSTVSRTTPVRRKSRV